MAALDTAFTAASVASSPASAGFGALIRSHEGDAVHYFGWLLTNLFVPVGLPILVLWLIDKFSDRAPNTATAVSFATKDGQLLWATMAVCAAGWFDVFESQALDSLLKFFFEMLLVGTFGAAFVLVMWWTLANRLNAGNAAATVTPKEEKLIKASKQMTIASVILFGFVKPFL